MTPPVATYRLQLRGDMTFDRAAEIVPYLRDLGVSHLYASPIFTATTGSTHGYDVTDFNAIDPALGGRAGFERLSRALHEAGLGLLLDIVPNHMAASPETAWWRDVVEWGARARHAGHFDIDRSRRLTLPFLGEPLDATLAAGELRLARTPQGLALGYYEMAWPLTPPSYAILAEAAPEDAALAAIARDAAAASPERAEAFHAAIRARLEDAEAGAIDATLARLSDDPAFIHRLHAAQPWQLTHWREARRDLAYRRFFEVTGLVGTRVEDPAVFDDVHALTLELVRDGYVQGLRVDHVDGLVDPAGYLHRLRAAAGPDTWILVEKILEGDEQLPDDWPVAGTTGYEVAGALTDLLIPAEGAAELDAAYRRLARAQPAEAQRAAAKREMITHNFAGELARVLALLLPAGTDADERAAMREALVALLVALPVYRTYGTVEGFRAADAELLGAAAAPAAAPSEDLDRLLERLAAPAAGEARIRFQQLSGPVMAKAVEDTLFYRHNAVLARNEVGNDPVHPPAATAAVHAAFAERRARQPRGLSATATHDTKRGEDARARLCALAEAPGPWIDAVEHWRDTTPAGLRDGALAHGTDWLIYQALAGAWPDTEAPPDDAALADLRARAAAYLVKALREAKARTTWTEPDADHEAAVLAFADGLLAPGNATFRADFHAVLRPYVAAGRTASLAQTLVRLTAPGIPDIYQGTEGGDLSFVDPDNRRPVDFARLAALGRGRPDATSPLAEAKSFLLRRALAERAQAPRLYAEGGYEPLAPFGPQADAVFAFARRHAEGLAVTLVPIRPARDAGLSEAERHARWAETCLPPPAGVDALENAFTGAREIVSGPLSVPRLLTGFPVALFTARAAD